MGSESFGTSGPSAFLGFRPPRVDRSAQHQTDLARWECPRERGRRRIRRIRRVRAVPYKA